MTKKQQNTMSDPQNTMKLNTRKRVQIKFNEPTLTKQSFKNECDINQIVAKFSQTGQLPMTNQGEPQYGDAPNLDLKESLDQVKSLHAEFYELSYEMRKKFKNKPENYANFLSQYEANPESFDQYFDQKISDVKVSDERSEPATLTPKKLPETE